MQYSSNTLKLRKLMADYHLSCAEVGQLLDRAGQTVRAWRSINDQDIPDHLLELLELKLSQREEVVRHEK